MRLSCARMITITAMSPVLLLSRLVFDPRDRPRPRARARTRHSCSLRCRTRPSVTQRRETCTSLSPAPPPPRRAHADRDRQHWHRLHRQRPRRGRRRGQLPFHLTATPLALGAGRFEQGHRSSSSRMDHRRRVPCIRRPDPPPTLARRLLLRRRLSSLALQRAARRSTSYFAKRRSAVTSFSPSAAALESDQHPVERVVVMPRQGRRGGRVLEGDGEPCEHPIARPREQALGGGTDLANRLLDGDLPRGGHADEDRCVRAVDGLSAPGVRFAQRRRATTGRRACREAESICASSKSSIMSLGKGASKSSATHTLPSQPPDLRFGLFFASGTSFCAWERRSWR